MEAKEKALTDISRRLEALLKLTAYLLVKDMTIAEGAPILRRLGLTVAEIASLFETSTGTVSVRLSLAKKKAKGKGRRSSP